MSKHVVTIKTAKFDVDAFKKRIDEIFTFSGRDSDTYVPGIGETYIDTNGVSWKVRDVSTAYRDTNCKVLTDPRITPTIFTTVWVA